VDLSCNQTVMSGRLSEGLVDLAAISFVFNVAHSVASSFRIGSATAPPIRLCLLEEPKPGRRQAVKAAAAKRGRERASLYDLTPVRFTVVSGKRPQASSGRIELALRAPCDGIGNPAVDV
jgi:hypothetical protein